MVDTGLADAATDGVESFDAGEACDGLLPVSISAGDERTERSEPFSGTSVGTAFWLKLSPGPGRGNVSVSAFASRLVTARTGRLPAPAADEVPSTLALLLFALRPGRKLSIGAFSFTRCRLLGGRAASAFRAREAAVDANRPLLAVPRVRVAVVAVTGRGGFGALVDGLPMAVPGREGGLAVGWSDFVVAVAAARAAVAAVGLNKELAAARVA